MEPGSHDELVYLAGFFDGEGCVSIGRATDPRAAYGARHQLLVQVAQTSRFPLDRCLRRWGGSIFEVKVDLTKCKPLWHWRLFRKEATISFCRDVRPYLLLKQAQVDLCIQFHALVRQKYSKWTTMPKEVWDERERLYHECRRLKLRPPGSTIGE